MSDLNNKKVGIVTCAYNSGKFFKDCLKGTLEQTRKPDEYIIVDDGSDDTFTWDQILSAISDQTGISGLKFSKSQHQFEANGIIFSLFQLQKNSGPSFARNIGLKYLMDKVDYIGICDSDDYYLPEKISKSLEIFLKHPEVQLCYSDYFIEDIKAGSKTREYKEPFDYKRLFEECIVSNNSFFTSEIIKRVGGYPPDIKFGEDWDLWNRIAESAGIFHIPEALYLYRLTGDNVTVKTPPEEFAKQVNIVRQRAYDRRSKRVQ